MLIVCLCGSTSRKQDFLAAQEAETLQGNIVLGPGVFSGADSKSLTADDIRRLHELHRRKIELADEVVIVAPDDRIGESTAEEIRFAKSLGKPIRRWEPTETSQPVDPVEALIESHRVQRLISNDSPTLEIPVEVKALRCSLIEEEAQEFRDALDANDIVEVADAIADLLYVVYGAARTFGIPAREVFAEVHRSNMTKLDDSGAPVLRSDGKVMKGPNFSPPNLLPILVEAGYDLDTKDDVPEALSQDVAPVRGLADHPDAPARTVYVAADFAHAHDADAMARRCEGAGAAVVSTWHRHIQRAEADAARTIGGPPAEQALAAATRNLREIDLADAVLVLTTGQAARGGRHFETGYAHAIGKPIALVGEVEHAFHHLPGITRVDPSGIEDFLRDLSL